MIANLYDVFSTSLFAPVGACLPELVLVHALGDMLIGILLLGLPLATWAVIRRRPELRPDRLLCLGVGVLGAMGLSHVMSFMALWLSAQGIGAAAKLVGALLAIAPALILMVRLPQALAWPVEMRRRSHRLIGEIGQRLRAEDALKDTLSQLERRVAERTQELQIATVSLSERERALAAKTQLMETTLNAIDYGICIFDPNDRLRAWNSAYERLTVLPRDSLREGLALDDLLTRVARLGGFGPGCPEALAHERLQSLSGDEAVLFADQVRTDGTVVRVGRFRAPDDHHVFTLADITRQRRLEDELRAAKERWDIASMGTNAGLFDWQVGSGELYLSPVWCRIVGYEPDELAPRLSTWRALVLEDDWAETRETVKRTFRAGSDRLQALHRLRHKDGHAVWVDARARVVRAPDGRPARVVGTITDITDRRRAEEALRAGEERLRSLYNRTPAMMHSVDENARLLSVSDYWLERLGYRREQVIGRPLTAFMTAATAAEIPDRFRTLREEGFVRDLPYQFVSASGQVLDVLLSAIAERHPDGRFRQSLAVLSDVSELRQLERRLRASQERFERAVSATRDGVWDWDLDSDTIYLSPIWFEIFGLPPVGDARVRGFVDARVHPDDRPEVAEAMRAHLERRIEHFQVVARMWHEHGRWIWVEAKGQAVLDQEGRPYRVVGTMTDVTARKESEAQLQRYADELRQSNQELEQFAYIASHDLQEPLRMVIGYCELLQHRYQGRLDEDANTFIEFAVDGARRMQGLINDLLAYSRVSSRLRPLVRVETADVLEDALDNLHRTIEESGARVAFGALPAVRGDASQLVQLFQNLIGNAIKYRSAAPPQIGIDAVPRGSAVEFAVRDNGIGIEPRYAERIFEIFKRLHTRDAYPGSGIGLAICKRIVDRHGGRIWLDIGNHRGSCFRFTLQAAAPKESHEPRACEIEFLESA